MSQYPSDACKQERMAETVRLIISRRERAPRSPRMERALKRLIMRYSRSTTEKKVHRSLDAEE